MPLTAAEKMKRRREKLKQEGKYEEYKKKQKLACKKSRKKKKAIIEGYSTAKRISVMKKERKKSNERVAKHRLQKLIRRDAASVNDSTSLNSSTPINPQAIGRATSRVRKVLPRCDLKKQIVLKRLLEENSTLQMHDIAAKKHASCLDEAVLEKIQDFYQRDDISRQSPGLKDYVSIRKENGDKDKIQTRYLYQSISETHALYVKEFGAIVGRSKFACLRPKFVYLSNKLPHNVCLCKYHENFLLAVNTLSYVISSPKYDHSFIESFLCESPKTECWMSRCLQCKDSLKIKLEEYQHACNNMPDEVTWYVWKDCERKLCKVQENGTVNELIEHVLEMSPGFYEHAYIKRQQSASYESDKKAVSSPNYDPKVALIQVDFSENFTCIAQDEIQSFHWVQPQVSLFTVSAWFSGKQHPIVIVSDDRHHDKKTATLYIDRILKELPDIVKEVHLWSDGPASQFKNRFIAEAIKLLEVRHDMHIIWNYFATSHGKGPVDGIGGSLKRTVRLQVMARKSVVFNAEQFLNASKESSVKVINITPHEIEATANAINLDLIFANSPKISGIAKCHILYWRSGNLITGQISKEFNKGIKEMQSFYDMIYGADVSEDDEDFASEDDNVPLALLKI